MVMKVFGFLGNKNKSNFTFRFNTFIMKEIYLLNLKQIQSKESLYSFPEASGTQKSSIQETQ